jgi:tetratricopeptide (TPR) repeat protein
MPNFCRRSLVILLCAAGVLIGIHAQAVAGVRLALVLGNGKYQTVPELSNPPNDAADLAQALRGVGFEVIEQRDGTREAMAKAVRDFSERLRSADVALFFYAGHGLQMNGENYLLPVDAKIENPADVRFNTINLSDIQQEMEGGGRANIVILDACRNNPFAEKLASGGRAAPTRGFSRVDATGEGSLIVYSTQPNNVALDGAGRNSPFTAALLKYVATPGLEVRQMISKVRGDVLRATDHRQTPWDSSSLVGDVYIAGPAAAATQAVIGQNPSAASAAVGVAQTVEPTASPRSAPATSVAASGPAAECERLVAPPPPFASPEQLKIAKTRNFAAGVPVCEAAVSANPNEPRMQFLLGIAYFSSKNYLAALPHYRKAADSGYAPAQDSLGAMFAQGLGVVKDYPRAFDLISKAAAAGDPVGIGDLGAMYSNGFFVKQDAAKALDQYEKSIEAGNSFALAQTGVMYYSGKGTPRDYNAAAQYFQQAADLNDGYSLKFLAIMYERGLLGPPDPAKAAELRLRAVQVDPTSQDPIVPPPQTTASPQRPSGVHYVRRIYRYRFLGCNWTWC